MLAKLNPPSATPLAGGGFALHGRRHTATAAVAALASMTSGCRGEPPHRAADTTAAVVACLSAGPGGTIRVRADSVGSLPSRMTFAELRARCPGARDTLLRGDDPADPGLAIPSSNGATVLAAQFSVAAARTADPAGKSVPVPHPGRPVHVWKFRGAGIELPSGARGDARWAELVRRYGPALLITHRARLIARFCALPDFEFTLEGPASGPAEQALLDSLSTRIPPDTRIATVTMLPDTPRPAHAECGGAGPYLEPRGSENRAIAASRGLVRRVGDTLFVRATSGAEQTFVDKPDNNDMSVEHTYMGTIAGGALHKVEVQGWETWWTTLVSVATGGVISTIGEPLVSPDGRRIASSAHGQTCEIVSRLEIFRVTDSIPVLEFEIEPRDCVQEVGWGPSDLQWLSADTLLFLANDARSQESASPGAPGAGRGGTRRMLAVRAGDNNTWRLVPAP